MLNNSKKENVENTIGIKIEKNNDNTDDYDGTNTQTSNSRSKYQFHSVSKLSGFSNIPDHNRQMYFKKIKYKKLSKYKAVHCQEKINNVFKFFFYNC